MHRDANGRACRRDLITGLQALGVGPLPGLDGHIEMAGRVGDLAEHRQIGGGQQAVRVRLHEEVEGLLPVSPGRRGRARSTTPWPAPSLIARLPNP